MRSYGELEYFITINSGRKIEEKFGETVNIIFEVPKENLQNFTNNNIKNMLQIIKCEILEEGYVNI